MENNKDTESIQYNQANKRQVKILLEEGVESPFYATSGSAGMDVRAYINGSVTLQPFEPVLIPLGFCMEVPLGLEAQLRPRSGLGKLGISIPNAPATIDSDYRGPVSVLLINLTTKPYTIQPNDRVAQMVIAPYEYIQWEEVEDYSDLSTTTRGSGGYGSTGKK